YPTWRPHIITPFGQRSRKSYDKRLIELSMLGGAEARALVKHRWEIVSKLDMPFDPADVEEVFTDKARFVKGVLKLMSYAFDERWLGKNEGDPWPSAQDLFISSEELRRRIDFARDLEQYWEPY